MAKAQRIGPTDLIGMRGLGHMAPCRGVHHACTAGWTYGLVSWAKPVQQN